MWLVQMIRSCDDDGVDLIQLEQILEIREHIRDAQTLGDGAGIRGSRC